MSAWAEVRAAIAGAPYPVHVLPGDPARARHCLAQLQITERSWLGAVVANTGGLVVDHGWLRVLGGGGHDLPDVLAGANPAAGELIIGHDVLGGGYAWAAAVPGARPTVHYFGPDTLEWQNLEQGYGEWLQAVLDGALTGFYYSLRWPGWEREVGQLPLGMGIHTYPPPWTAEGQDLSVVSRRPIGMPELVDLHRAGADRRSGGAPPEQR